MEGFQSLLILMVVVWIFGKLFRILHLPIIFGELIGGIIVGPMVLGLVNPDNETIKILAELGIFFLMLHTGLETNPNQLFKASKKSILVAMGGIILPFAGAFGVSYLFGLTIIESIFIALGLSMTAIAISARIFKDYSINKTNVAHISIAAAVINDIIGIMLLSVILSLFNTGNVDAVSISMLLLKTVVFFAVVIFGGLKLSKYLGHFLDNKSFTFSLMVALTLGLIAESIGLHIIIGAFLAGLFIREEVLDEEVFRKVEDRIYGITYGFLAPIFFTSLAFHLDLSVVFSNVWLLIILFFIAIFGKIIGSGGAALFQKISPKKSLMIGLAMNSRGAVDLIIASIGLKAGIINAEIFSMLVLIAFLSTLVAIFGIKPMVKHAE